LLSSQGAEEWLAKSTAQSLVLPPPPLSWLKPGQKPLCIFLKGEERQWGDWAEICPACPSSVPTHPSWDKF